MNNTPGKLRFTIYDLRMILAGITLVLLGYFGFPAKGVSQDTASGVYPCIAIRYDVTGNTFPSRWYNKKIHAEAESLARRETENVNRTVRDALSKYPDRILCDYLSTIYILKTMRFYGVPYGGTSYEKTVYITDDEDNLTCSYDRLENYFHHEFSSILLHKNSCKFEKRKWKRLNPHEFRYGDGGLQAILNNDADMRFDDELNERGFLTRYSEASLEEDFNVYSQNLFNGGQPFWTLVDKFPKVKAKTDLIIQFYHTLNSTFTFHYFKSLTL